MAAIKRLEVLNYRCLRHVSQELDAFHVLIGPNASGKTTFLDALAFLRDLITDGLEKALLNRSSDPRKLMWCGTTSGFEIAVEVDVPEKLRDQLENRQMTRCRYEIRVGYVPKSEEIGLLEEAFWLLAPDDTGRRAPQTSGKHTPTSILRVNKSKGWRPGEDQLVVKKVPTGNDQFLVETGRKYNPTFKLGHQRSALKNVPEDESQFPVATWFKRFLVEGIVQLSLNSLRMRTPSQPGRKAEYKPDGSSLPWVIKKFAKENPDGIRSWINHLRVALPDLESVTTHVRPEDSKCYLTAEYRNGAKVPSWLVSDGTLRLMALTLLAYMPSKSQTILVEEPENGVHPSAVETLFQSLSSIYDSQVLLATHSPVILSIAEQKHVLCFRKAEDGSTSVVEGNKHPALRDWRGEVNLGVLYASGVLG